MKPTAETSASAPSLMSSIGGVTIRKAWMALLVFFLLSLALNGVQLHTNNDHLPYGPVRTFWMAVSAPIAKICAACHLNLPRESLQSTAGAALNHEE